MTLLLLAVGAGLAALGTRAAAVAFAGSAVLAALGTSLPAVGVWAAATALGLVTLRISPRRLALPVLGAGAALAVGSARNTAVVAALWVLGTVASVLSRGRGSGSARWALSVCVADIPFLGAVVWTALRVGFEGWPLALDGIGLVVLLLAAGLRALLAAGPDDDVPEAGLLPVRVQTVVLLHVVLQTGSPARGILVAATLVGAAGFAAGGGFRRPATRDVVQEISLVAMVLAVGALGWGPAGWEWGALGAGTLIHNLRLRLQAGPLAPLAGEVLAGGGVMLPFLPVVLVALEGSLRADDVAKVAVPVALLLGLVARAAHDRPAHRREGAAKRWEPAAAAAVCAATIAAGVWAPILTLPSTIGGDPVGWAPGWSVAVVLALGVLAAGAGRVREGGGSRPPLRLAWPDPRLPARSVGDRALVGAQAALAAVAVGIWVVGTLRGFL